MSLANFASSQLTATCLYSSTKMIAPDTLISIIIEEAERQKVQGTSCSDHRDHDKDKDEALAAAPAGKSTYRSKGKQTRRGGAGEAKDPSCWVCSSTAHNEVTFSRYTRPPWADNFRRVTTTLRRALGHRI